MSLEYRLTFPLKVYKTMHKPGKSSEFHAFKKEFKIKYIGSLKFLSWSKEFVNFYMAFLDGNEFQTLGPLQADHI